MEFTRVEERNGEMLRGGLQEEWKGERGEETCISLRVHVCTYVHVGKNCKILLLPRVAFAGRSKNHITLFRVNLYPAFYRPVPLPSDANIPYKSFGPVLFPASKINPTRVSIYKLSLFVCI